MVVYCHRFNKQYSPVASISSSPIIFSFLCLFPFFSVCSNKYRRKTFNSQVVHCRGLIASIQQPSAGVHLGVGCLTFSTEIFLNRNENSSNVKICIVQTLCSCIVFLQSFCGYLAVSSSVQLNNKIDNIALSCDICMRIFSCSLRELGQI